MNLVVDNPKRMRARLLAEHLCRQVHGHGDPKRCRGCKELANPRPWWMLWPRGVLTHLNRRIRS